MNQWRRLAGLALCWGMALGASAEALPTYHLVLENHLFFPSRLEVPAGTKFVLVIENRDSTPEEFDSFDLNREKVIFPNRSSRVYVGPLEAGTFQFSGEYNSSTARGVVVAVPGPRSADREESSNAD